MTYEDKQLLLKDLSARLPYYPIVSIAYNYSDKGIVWEFDILRIKLLLEIEENDSWKYIKPYLRPMSSMTEEEKIELYQIAGFYYLSNNELLKDEWIQFSGALSEDKLFLPYPIWEDNLNKVYDWLNKHHFDYRGLIEKGLALEAPDDMY